MSKAYTVYGEALSFFRSRVNMGNYLSNDILMEFARLKIKDDLTAARYLIHNYKSTISIEREVLSK